MLARRVLELSPLAIVVICVTLTLSAKLAHVVWIKVFLLCSIVWAFALYAVAQKAANERAGLGWIAFPITIILAIATATIPQVYEAGRGDLLYYLGPSSVILAVVSIGLAVSALLRSESKSDWVFTWSSVFTILGILLLPLGAWFVRPRVEDLLRR